MPPRVLSPAEQAENKIFAELSEHIQTESKKSVFAIGGAIPITALDRRFICESDGTASEGGHEPAKESSRSHGTEQDPMQIDSSDDESNSRPELSDEYSSFPVHRAAGGHDRDTESLEDFGSSFPQDTTSHRMRCDPVTVRWDSSTNDASSHSVILPCDNDHRPFLDQLLKDCQPASFGLGGKDVLDETYRKAGKLDESAFCTNFSPYALGIIETVAQALAPNNCRTTNETHGIRAELYKLNVYAAPSGKFKAHVDTPRSTHQIGSLVVCLPNVHEGGQLVLRHQGRETVYDWSGEKGRNAIQWAAFFSDCEHEVLEVSAGERFTLTYNLYATCSANTASIDPERVELYRAMKTFLQQPGFYKNGTILGYHCAHAYPHTSEDTIPTLPAVLKGIDKIVYSCFTATNHPTRLRHLLDPNRLHENMGYNDFYATWLAKENPANSDHRLDGLRHLYHYAEDEYNKAYRPDAPPRYSWENINGEYGEIFVLADKLVPFKFTESGMCEELGTGDIIEEWTKDLSIQKVKWLNKPTHQELALVHGAYGNEPELDTKYARLVITLEIPPLQAR